MTKYLDYMQSGDEFAGMLEDSLNQLVAGSISKIHITNVISAIFCDNFGVEEVTDFNGWQCDWWSTMSHHNVKICVCGGAWYGTVDLFLEDD